MTPRFTPGRYPSPYSPLDYALADAVPLMRKLRMLAGAPGTHVPVEWGCDAVLDQGATGHCVGFSYADFGNCLPVDSQLCEKDAHDLYYAAKEEDGEPGGENGSCMRSGAEAMKKRGRIQTYAFAKSLDNIKNWVLSQGSVAVGTMWYERMFEPDSEGMIVPRGNPAGGHAYLLIGYNPATDIFTFLNSWGAGWGLSGRFKMKAKDWASLFADDGEAVVALEMPVEEAKLVFGNYSNGSALT